MFLDSSSRLADYLVKVLPKACRFTIHHLSTPPTRCAPLFAVFPGEPAEETYCEDHFLSISINYQGSLVQVYAIEVLVYSTEFLTTLFVSKADSTGYLHLLNLSPDIPSPVKTVSTAFLQYLIENRKRNDRRLVLSLFARAQNQYLFPGSIENHHKHVLDDRNLIRWWCKVIDPILESFQNDYDALADTKRGIAKLEQAVKSHGYLRVPGCDNHETKAFLPKHEQRRQPGDHQWHISDPLRGFGKSPDLPERCLIPRFPDDPKARFMDQLDEELPDQDDQLSPPASQNEERTARDQAAGRWRSVNSLEQFWELMSFRQECSSGRLVGFLWATFQPVELLGQDRAIDEEERSHTPLQTTLPTPEVSQNQDPALGLSQFPLRSSPVRERPSTPLNRAATPSPQMPAPTPQKKKEADIQRQPEETKSYFWPISSRGEVVLRQKDYQRVSNLLLHLDYADIEVASDSTRKWVNDIAERAGKQSWGQEVIGTVSTSNIDAKIPERSPLMLNNGLLRKKKRPIDESNGPDVEAGSKKKEFEANVLSAGLIRKKAKVTNDIKGSQSSLQSKGNLAPD